MEFSSITSYQYTNDEMVLDQDFQPRPIFTLIQSQNEHAVTQDFVFRTRKPRQTVANPVRTLRIFQI